MKQAAELVGGLRRSLALERGGAESASATDAAIDELEGAVIVLAAERDEWRVLARTFEELARRASDMPALLVEVAD